MMRKVIVISDTHVGSVYGLFPPNYKTSSGNEIKLNPLQEELYGLWTKMQEDLNDDYDTVFLLGDLINGVNRKAYGKEQVIADHDEQRDAVVQLLQPICKNKIVVGVRGSGYHCSLDYEVDSDICKALNGTFGGAIKNIRLKGTNKIINISHGGGSSPMYTGTKMSREIMSFLIANSLEKIPKVDMILRAHIHHSALLEENGITMVINPCWEGPRLNAYSAANYPRYQPDIGITKIEASEDIMDTNIIPYELKYERENITAL